MTENEAIEVFEKPSKHIKMVHKTKNEMEFYAYSSDLVKAFEIAIQALEEIQQYRALGTVEEVKAFKEKNETLKTLYENARKEGSNLIAKERAKAIDEFVDKMYDVSDFVRDNSLIGGGYSVVTLENIEKIAEQMKGE